MKKGWIQKGIVSLIILAIFLAPFSTGIKIKKVEAQTLTPASQNATTKLSKEESIELSTPDKGIGYSSAIFDIKATGLKLVHDGDISGYKINTNIIDITAGETDSEGSYSEGKSFGKDTVGGSSEKTIRICYGGDTTPDGKPCDSYESNTLKENNDYKLKITFHNYYPYSSYSYTSNKVITETENGPSVEYYWTFRTGSKENNTSGTITGDVKSYNNYKLDLHCSVLPSFKPVGCLAEVFYAFWEVSAIIARLAGHILDFFIYYSTNSSSYDNTFVKQAWAAVRDIANIFFIIALLFIAVKTVLGLNVSNNKKLVGTVVIIALIINFSLFTTQLVIDGSNILAKIFYNNISSVDENNKVLESNSNGEKTISIGIIQKFNPQELVTQEVYNSSQGFFIFLTLLLIAITLYTAYIFFSVALLFVARVVSLWISMIFSPIAFASYTVPFDIPGFGHKEWWDNLLNNAFLAPIFIFMLYIIILFTGFLKDIINYTNNSNLDYWANLMQHLMSVIIPFIIITVLLNKAKELAEKYAGEMGKAIQKGVAMVGGVVAGTTIGVTAAAGQAILGHAGKGIFENKKLASWETNTDKTLGGWGKRFIGKNLRTIGGGDDGKGGMAGSSFDLRKGLGGAALKAASGLTGINLGHQSKFLMKESGGYEADLKRRDEKRKKRAEGLKVKEGEPEKQHLNKMQEEHRDISLKNEKAIHDKDREILAAKSKRETAEKLANSTKGTPEYEANQKAFKDAAAKVSQLEAERSNIKNGIEKDEKGNYLTDNGLMSKKQLNIPIEEAEKELASATFAAKQAEKVIESTTKLIESAKIDAEKARTEATKTIEEAAILEQKLGSSLAPDDIALKQASRNKVMKAKEEIEKAEKAIIDAEMNLNIAKTNKTSAESDMQNASTKSKELKEKIKSLEEADRVDREKGGKGKIGRSQNDYEDILIPEAEHEVKHINDKRISGYADNIQNQFAWPWNKAARKKSAHDIRMGVKVENHGGGKGHGGGHLFEAIAAEALVGGSKGHSSSHAHTTDKHDSGNSHGSEKSSGGDAHGGGNAHGKAH